MGEINLFQNHEKSEGRKKLLLERGSIDNLTYLKIDRGEWMYL